MSVTRLKRCYGCGKYISYNGFSSTPEIPMCALCRESSVKPRYVYINATKEILPKYDYQTDMQREMSKKIIQSSQGEGLFCMNAIPVYAIRRKYA